MVVRKAAFAQWNPGYIDRHEARGDGMTGQLCNWLE